MSKYDRTKVSGIPQGFSEHTFPTGDVTLNYVVGPQNGPPLLLIPGQMESWQGYKCVLPELSQNFHIFVPDLRGHGKSTWTPGRYSYNICGEDLRHFIREVIQKPTLVAGLSSGGVLAIWLGAYSPEDILAVIAEDPPIFSSIWPRIQNEKFLARSFKLAVDFLGKPAERDLEGYFSESGIPAPGKEDLLKIPRFIVAAIFTLFRINQALRPSHPYDTPFLPFFMRISFKFLSEYDTDFSRATLDGELSRDFSPQDALSRVKCPMLLMRADATRHETWGLLGAIDDDDLKRMLELVADLQVVQIAGRHDLHISRPRQYMDEVVRFVGSLRDKSMLDGNNQSFKQA